MRLTRLRAAARVLRRHPGFSTVVILSLATAIALNTTMYSVFDAMAHPRVDVRDPESLASITMYGDYRHRVTNRQRDSLLRIGGTAIERTAWTGFANIGFGITPLIVGPDNRYHEGVVNAVDTAYFPLLGVHMLAGRAFIPSDLQAEQPPIVLSERTANTLFGSAADAVGSKVRIVKQSYVVVGVITRYSSFHGEQASAYLLDSESDKAMFKRIVRLKPGTTQKDFGEQLDRVAQRIAVMAGEPAKDVAFRVALPNQSDVNLRAFDYALMFSVFAVLLVACANVANMQLARGIARGRELAVHTALGATRMRLIRKLLAESAILAVVGLGLGIVLTFVAWSLLIATIPPAVGHYVVEPHMSWRVLVFALTAMLLCIALVGLAPAIKVSRVDPNELLKAGAGTGATRRNRRGYGYLVVVEIGLTLALLSGAAVMVRAAIERNNQVWKDVDPTHLAVGYVRLPLELNERRSAAETFATIVSHLRAVPGVTHASVQTGGGLEHGAVTISDSSGMREISFPQGGYATVSPSYFRVMDMPIVDGRDFAEGERDHAAVIIDEYTAKKLWPNASPIGSLIKFGDSKSTRPFVRIVGVAGYRGKDGKPKPFNMANGSGAPLGRLYYLPGPADSVTGRKEWAVVRVTVRAAGKSSSIVPGLSAMGLGMVQTMEEALDYAGARASRRFLAKLFALFAALALSLAAFGVYGVVAHSVAERRRELGVRVALGATSRDILHAVLRESVIIALIGMAIGLLCTKYGVMMLGQFALENDIYNAPLFAGVALFLVTTASAAAFVPAMRATRVDPTESLRSE